MRILPLLALIISALVATPAWAAEIPTVAPEQVGMSGDKLALVDEAIETLITEKRLAGAIVVVARKGSIVHFGTYGLMDLETTKPMRPDAIMRFYSMSKAITSAAVMMLADDGKLQVDDPVSQFIPEFSRLRVHTKDGLVAQKREMTIADLLRHTSGLTYGGSGIPAIDSEHRQKDVLSPTSTIAEMCQNLADIPLAYQPGQDWQYSVSIDVLGRIVEVASGKPLDQFFSERIFEPLDMNDTGFYVPKEKHDRFAQVYNSDSKGTLTIGDNTGKADFSKPRAFLSGGGGLVSTARDYLRFLIAIQNGGRLGDIQLLSEKSVVLMTTDQLPDAVPNIYFGAQKRIGVGFGFGFSVRNAMSEWDPQGRVGEYGWGGMASTHYWVSPGDDLVVITLEQTLPYSFMTEFVTKGLIYDAIID
jgi:CubicO group peptidase (beta-lactamase class C family)